MISARLALLAIGCGALAHASLADEVPPTSFACTFDKGQSWSFDGGAYKSVAPSKLTFEITAIDLDKQAADLNIDQKLAGKLRVVRALNANSYLEVANEGFLNLPS